MHGSAYDLRLVVRRSRLNTISDNVLSVAARRMCGGLTSPLHSFYRPSKTLEDISIQTVIYNINI